MKSSHPSVRAARLVLAVAASLALACGGLPGAATAAQTSNHGMGHVDDDVARRAAGNPAGLIRVIITRAHSGDSDNDVRSHSGRVIGKLSLANATVAELPASQIADLARQSGVVRISYDAPVSLQTFDPITACCDRLHSVYPLAVDSAYQWQNTQLRGTGVGVAVIDSGVNPAHPDFAGATQGSASRVIQVVNGMSASPTLSGIDDNGHGTFVAGIIAGRGWGLWGVVAAGSYMGTAPDANIISIKVSDSTGMAHISDVISALEWASKHRRDYNIRVVNLSLVSTMAASYQTDMLDAAVELAWLQGLVVVVAAGNGGPGAAITSPANDPFVLTVGATDDLGTPSTSDDVLAAFSSYGTTIDGFAKPELVAPGRHIVSTLSSPTSPLALNFPTRVLGNATYIQLSGTSASAPVVSGAVAQLLQARPSLSPGQVKWLLTHTARSIAGPGTGAGYPRVGAAANYSGLLSSADTAMPNQYLRAAYAAQSGLSFSSISWDAISWDSISWDSISWDSISWDSISWDSISWDSLVLPSAN